MELTTSENLECTTAHQSIRVVDVLPETGQNTKMDATLAKPEAEAMRVLVFKEEDKQYHSAEERLLQDQGKSPQKGIMMTLKSSQKESLPPLQRMNKAKTVTVKLNVQLKQTELALIPSDNSHAICKSRFSLISSFVILQLHFSHDSHTHTHSVSLSVSLFLSLF
jgi:hypothetical protein